MNTRPHIPAHDKAIEAACRGMYGKSWDGPPEKMPCDAMKNVWRDYAKRAIAGMSAEGFEVGAKCPFAKGQPAPGLSPTDPCPICGDLGTLESTEKPSRCIG